MVSKITILFRNQLHFMKRTNITMKSILSHRCRFVILKFTIFYMSVQDGTLTMILTSRCILTRSLKISLFMMMVKIKLSVQMELEPLTEIRECKR